MNFFEGLYEIFNFPSSLGDDTHQRMIECGMKQQLNVSSNLVFEQLAKLESRLNKLESQKVKKNEKN